MTALASGEYKIVSMLNVLKTNFLAEAKMLSKVARAEKYETETQSLVPRASTCAINMSSRISIKKRDQFSFLP